MTTTFIETRRCFHCGEHGYLELPTEGVARYEAGALIQNAFPELSAPLREQIISGTHPKCWDEMFSPFSEDDEEYEEE